MDGVIGDVSKTLIRQMRTSFNVEMKIYEKGNTNLL